MKRKIANKQGTKMHVSRIRSVAFCLIATRGRYPIILTFTLHRLLHVTLDCVSHHPLHWLHTAVTNLSHTHTQYNTHSDPSQTAKYCLVCITASAIATLRSRSEFPQSSLALFIVCSPVSWSLPVISSCLISACPEVYSLCWIFSLPWCLRLHLHLASHLAVSFWILFVGS